tara:strand:+ start:48 stop:440 length:393 start_codon:yes stop_codon:yes gene_type:complete
MPYKNKEDKNKNAKEWYYKNHKKCKENKREKKKIYYYKNKKEENRKSKEYFKTPIGKKKRKIGNWKTQGMICEDWDKMYDDFNNITLCNYCNEPFKNLFHKTLDHNHLILDNPNIRAVLCRTCNTKKVLD